jgi:hypothetical protein
MISIRSLNDLQKFLGQTLLFSFFIVVLLSVAMLCVLNFQHEKDKVIRL